MSQSQQCMSDLLARHIQNNRLISKEDAKRGTTKGYAALVAEEVYGGIYSLFDEPPINGIPISRELERDLGFRQLHLVQLAGELEKSMNFEFDRPEELAPILSERPTIQSFALGVYDAKIRYEREAAEKF